MPNKLAMMAVSAALCGAAPVQAAGYAAAQPSDFEDQGSITWGTQGDDGVIWLRLWDPYVRYRIAREPDEKMNSLKTLLSRASDGWRTIQLRFDGANGRVNRRDGTLDYSVCAIVLDDLQFESSSGCGNKAARQASSAGSALALARALKVAGDFAAAQDLLVRTKVPSDLATRKLLLQVRAENETELAATGERLSPETDAMIAASLTDFRALAELEPHNAEHQFSIAAALLDLGSYAEARAVYDDILARWPDEDYRVAVRIGALHRVQGDYENALQALNDLSARNGPQEGMRYHYHRGWTLSLLGRFDEAISEFTEGLKTQPDYSSAYVRRACAYASIGRLKDALADTSEAARLLAALPGAKTTKTLRDSMDEVASMRREIEAALANTAGEQRPSLCSGATWSVHERPRARSTMLPTA